MGGPRLPRVVVAAAAHQVEAAIRYAVRAPDRVAALVLLQPHSSHTVAAAAEGVSAMSARAWAETVVTWMDPQRTDDPAAFVRLNMESIDTHDRPRLFHAVSGWDIEPFLHQVQIPTLIMHWPDYRANESTVVRRLAASIPGAVLTSRAGDASVWFDPNRTEIIDAMTRFADDAVGVERVAGQRVEATVAPAFRTLLFTDLESSTALTQALGDAKAQEILHGHNDAVRAALAAHDGEEVKHTGDGIMAAFGSAVSAVGAALQIQRDLAGAEVRVRIGLNAGEPIAEDDDYFGTAVQLAARVCDRAEPGQVLVSNVVRELCAGKTFNFADQGEATLKGFPEPVRLFVVQSTLGDDLGEEG